MTGGHYNDFWSLLGHYSRGSHYFNDKNFSNENCPIFFDFNLLKICYYNSRSQIEPFLLSFSQFLQKHLA